MFREWRPPHGGLWTSVRAYLGVSAGGTKVCCGREKVFRFRRCVSGWQICDSGLITDGFRLMRCGGRGPTRRRFHTHISCVFVFLCTGRSGSTV